MLPDISVTSVILTALVCGLLIVFSVVYGNFKTRHLPPQPGPAFPVIGHMYKLTKTDPRDQFRKWRELYGDVFSFYLGRQLVVVLNGYNTIKEALVKRGDAFSDRPKHFIDIASGTPFRGILSSSGADWKEQKSFILSVLKEQGLGSNHMVDRVINEAECLTKHLQQYVDRPLNVHSHINAGVGNVISSLLFGSRFDYDDTIFQRLIQITTEVTELSASTNFLNEYPVLRYLPGDPFSGKKYTRNLREIISLIFKRWNSLKQVRDEKEIEFPQSIIGAYIEQMNKKRQSGVETFMDEDALRKIVFDLFAAGTETTSATIEWCLLFIVHNLDVQRKIFEEIVHEIGTERLPNIHDRSRLVYLNAVIMETQRLGNIGPFALLHSNHRNTDFRDFNIPKDSYIIAHVGSIFEDPIIWGEDAQAFRPERFMDSSGQLIHREELIPFSIGRRACPGESLAKMELFLFLGMLFQKFEFLPLDPSNLPSLEPKFGLTVKPEPFKLRMVPRCKLS